ncbi:MAG: hypothetical protein WD607_06260 [Candidatus Paceibacterota bacterium]
MEIVRTFELPNTKLLAIKYEGDELDALEMLQKQWYSIEWLKEFFRKFHTDYFEKYGRSKLNSLVLQSRGLADELFERLYELAKNIESNALAEFFNPLDNRESDSEPYELQKLKAKGKERKSFLRIYALRFKGTIIVTGGAIKLTDRMEERKHTNDELKKLELVKSFLDKDNPDVEFSYLDVE